MHVIFMFHMSYTVKTDRIQVSLDVTIPSKGGTLCNIFFWIQFDAVKSTCWRERSLLGHKAGHESSNESGLLTTSRWPGLGVSCGSQRGDTVLSVYLDTKGAVRSSRCPLVNMWEVFEVSGRIFCQICWFANEAGAQRRWFLWMRRPGWKQASNIATECHACHVWWPTKASLSLGSMWTSLCCWLTKKLLMRIEFSRDQLIFPILLSTDLFVSNWEWSFVLKRNESDKCFELRTTFRLSKTILYIQKLHDAESKVVDTDSLSSRIGVRNPGKSGMAIVHLSVWGFTRHTNSLRVVFLLPVPLFWRKNLFGVPGISRDGARACTGCGSGSISSRRWCWFSRPVKIVNFTGIFWKL